MIAGHGVSEKLVGPPLPTAGARTVESANDLVLDGEEEQLDPLVRPRQKPRIVPRPLTKGRRRHLEVLGGLDDIAKAPG